MKGLILGGGVTGLAAGLASGVPVLEASGGPGGICASYMKEGYRFERGGGHWLFGLDDALRPMLEAASPLKTYRRKSAVYFAATGLKVPYPLQYHLRCLPRAVARRALAEVGRGGPARTMRDWLKAWFGPTLCELFFEPFHDRYTAGLHARVAPQDSYKSPVDMRQARAGAAGGAADAGYNVEFAYPALGLGAMTGAFARRCDLRPGSAVRGIDLGSRRVALGDGRSLAWDRLVSTLPLPVTARLCGWRVPAAEAPFTSVLVLNVGAARGPRTPAEHWLYVPDAASGFHRVGFYSNVDASFLPRGARGRTSLYVERAYPGGARPTPIEEKAYAAAALAELRAWGFIGAADVVDASWVEYAYTYSLPGSTWRARTMARLAAEGILPAGRYGRWRFQGICESLHEGLAAGAALRAA
ncbi:MAG: FAD-dependent oxidoreductase [Elusimicrobia bacterium]|nr:FAD-dependent oxidoreductase [Elusimicrobiota bacterium]